MVEYADTAGVPARDDPALLRRPRGARAVRRLRQLPARRASTPTSASCVRKILSGIARAGERYGRHRIVAMLLGDTGELPPALGALSTTGLLRHETAEAIRGWIDASIAAGLVVVSKDQYRTLSLTATRPRGDAGTPRGFRASAGL